MDSTKSVDVTLRTGAMVTIRPIASDDSAALVHFHEQLSDRTIYYRHFAAKPHLSDADVERFTTVDHNEREAYVALSGSDIVGVGRWDHITPDLAEVAFVIRDDFQQLGLGTILFELLAQSASALGVKQFVADMLPQNRGMVRLMEEYGNVTSRTSADGVVEIVVDLRDFAGPTLTGDFS